MIERKDTAPMSEAELKMVSGGKVDIFRIGCRDCHRLFYMTFRELQQRGRCCPNCKSSNLYAL